MGGSSVELIGRTKRFRVTLHGEEYVYEEEVNYEQDWIFENIYKVSEDGTLVPVEDTSVRDKIREVVKDYDQHISI